MSELVDFGRNLAVRADLSPAARAVGAAIVRHAMQGPCRLPNAALAVQTGLSERDVQFAIIELDYRRVFVAALDGGVRELRPVLHPERRWPCCVTYIGAGI